MKIPLEYPGKTRKFWLGFVMVLQWPLVFLPLLIPPEHHSPWYVHIPSAVASGMWMSIGVRWMVSAIAMQPQVKCPICHKYYNAGSLMRAFYWPHPSHGIVKRCSTEALLLSHLVGAHDITLRDAGARGYLCPCGEYWEDLDCMAEHILDDLEHHIACNHLRWMAERAAS